MKLTNSIDIITQQHFGQHYFEFWLSLHIKTYRFCLSVIEHKVILSSKFQCSLFSVAFDFISKYHYKHEPSEHQLAFFESNVIVLFDNNRHQFPLSNFIFHKLCLYFWLNQW
jgi:hypothetical protein